MTAVALFSNKAGVGTTTLVYHVAHMMSRLGLRVLAVDLDPQTSLTSLFLDEENLNRLWQTEEADRQTIASAVRPIVEGLGDIAPLLPRALADNLWLLAGDLALSRFEEPLARAWLTVVTDGDHAAFRVTTALYRIIRAAAESVEAEIVLLDVGPNLGALSRSALLLADNVVLPLGSDFVSAQGLRNLGPALAGWRRDWQQIVLPAAPAAAPAPRGTMNPLGYLVMQPSAWLGRPLRGYQSWLDQMPHVYSKELLGEDLSPASHEIATVRNYRSLRALAHEAHKPMFDIRPADGAIGSTQRYVQICFTDFRELARELLRRLGIADPSI